LLAERLRLIGTENVFKIGPCIAEVEAAGYRVIRCNIGEPDFELADEIRDEVKRQLDAGNTHYSDPQGLPQLREAVARQLGETRGLAITPDRVVIFPGAKPVIGLSQLAYVDPGDEVVYPTPGFPIYEGFTGFVGGVPRPLPLREELGFGIRSEDLERVISGRTKLIFLNFPSNPTGGVADRPQLEEIAEVILRRAPADVRVVSDEIYEHIHFDGAEHRSIASVPGMERITIVASGVSKGFAWTGGRVGWAAFPSAAEALAFRNLNINFFSCVSAYNQEGARLALDSAASARRFREMAAEYQRRRDMVIVALNAIDGISCQVPRGAFYAFPNISGACRSLGAVDAHAEFPAAERGCSSPATLFQLFLLYRYHVATLDRRSFGVLGSEGQHFLRISVATAVPDLEEAMRRIAAAAVDREGFREFLRSGRCSY